MLGWDNKNERGVARTEYKGWGMERGVNFRNERGCHQMPKEKKDEKEFKLPDEQVGIERKKK